MDKDSYRLYLKTPWWYARRNQALKDAGYRCAQCESKRDLQVHHVSYERLGCERGEDLAVVCRGCHLGHHYLETQESIGLYSKILSAVIQELPEAEFSDVIEEAKRRCAQAKIRLHPDRFNAAVARVNGRISFRPPASSRELYEESAEGEPLTRAEAAGLCAKLAGSVIIKHMPEVKPVTERDRDRAGALKIILQAIRDQALRCDAMEEEKP